MCNNGKWSYITWILAFSEAAESLELWPEGPGSSLRLGVAMTARAVYTLVYTERVCYVTVYTHVYKSALCGQRPP